MLGLLERPISSPNEADLSLVVASSDLFFKSSDERQLHTSKLCGPTSYFDEGIASKAISSRKCVRCPADKPWSGGFASTMCQSCDWLKKNNAYVFAQVCEYTPTPKSDGDSTTPDDEGATDFDSERDSSLPA